MKKSKFLFSLLLTVNAFFLVAQDTLPSTDSTEVESLILQKANNLFSPRLSFTIPNPTSNKSFSKSFVGIYQVNGGLNMAIYKGAFVGVTFSNAYFKLNKTINRDYAANINVYNAAIKLGGDFYIGDKNRTVFSFDISAGQSYVKFSSFVCKSPIKKLQITDYKSPFVELGTSILFLVDSNWGIGPIISYSLIQRTFDPYEVCLEEYATYSKTNKGPTQYLSFGFVCYYTFLNK